MSMQVILDSISFHGSDLVMKREGTSGVEVLRRFPCHMPQQ
jgi:hypothetical protein